MSQPKQTAVRLELLDGNIALVTLDQPGSRANTLGQAMLGELEGMVKQLLARSELRGLVLRSGKPGMFIAGADLRELGSAPQDPATVRGLLHRGLAIVRRVEELAFPTVAAIDGACMGGGLELALGFDFRIASDSPKTQLAAPAVKIGLIPGWGGTQRLTRLIGPSQAAELICTGDSVGARKALEMGFVDDVVPAERLLGEAQRLL